MTPFAADLHLHSRFSEASASQSSLTEIIGHAEKKGLHLLGTGDFTHPRWLAEIEAQLDLEDSGLLKPRNESRLRLLLSTEVETHFYVRGKRCRVHLLLTAPDFEAVHRLRQALAKLTDFQEDGVPRFSLPAAELSQRILEASPRSMIIPAHVWTPWTSVYGSKFGFDTLQDCFETMSGEIHAVETGVSSDPAMCWRVSHLDGKQILSFSDAHHPQQLGREFTLIDGELSYAGVHDAFTGGGKAQVAGTVEYCSELGRFYFNGHSLCKIVKSPVETRFEGKSCPACRKEITIGALQRALEISDRTWDDLDVIQEGGWIHSGSLDRPPFRRMIPLREIIASIYGVREHESQTVREVHEKSLERGVSERELLLEVGELDLRRFVPPAVAEGIVRVRDNCYKISPGYDGIYGQVQIFEERETAELAQLKLF